MGIRVVGPPRVAGCGIVSPFDAAAILSELKSFQRDAVEHVIHRFYGPGETSRRFLVADETGLGKSVVARGVIARAIERLEHDDSVGTDRDHIRERAADVDADLETHIVTDSIPSAKARRLGAK